MPGAAVMITVAPTGAETRAADAPGLPVTLDDLVRTAVTCEQAGAALIHVHVRDGHDAPSLDIARLTETVDALRAHTDLVVQLSTGGAVTDSLDARLAVLEAQPDSCSLTCGTVNFGTDVFLNPWPFIVELYRTTQARGIVPEFELFDLGHIATLHRLLDAEGPPCGGRVHCDLVLGVPGGLPGTLPAMAAAVAALPSDASWSATGVGRNTLPVLLTAIAHGGHARVGMEDTLTYAPGRPVRENAELVARAAWLAAAALRPVATPAQARELLGLVQPAEVPADSSEDSGATASATATPHPLEERR